MRDQLKQQFRTGLGERHEAQLIHDEKLVRRHLLLKPEETPFVTGSIISLTSAAAVVNPTDKPFWHAAKPRPRATWVFPVPLDPFAAYQLEHLHLTKLGDGGEVETIKAFDDGEFGCLDPAIGLVSITLDHSLSESRKPELEYRRLILRS